MFAGSLVSKLSKKPLRLISMIMRSKANYFFYRHYKTENNLILQLTFSMLSRIRRTVFNIPQYADDSLTIAS